MSQVEVDKIIPQSGTTLTVGESGDTITVPSGATFDASNATTTLPATVVTTDGSQTLTNKTIDASQLVDASLGLAKLSATGTKDATTFLRGDNTFNAPPNTGITEADQWRLTADITNTDGVLTSNLERVDDGAFGYIGTGMTESSGIFSFPSTGLYLIHATMESVSQTDGIVLNLQISVDNSSYVTAGTITSGDGDSHATNFSSGSKIIFFNVTNTATHKARFDIGSSTNSTVRGNSSLNETCFSFIRLGDSV